MKRLFTLLYSIKFVNLKLGEMDKLEQLSNIRTGKLNIKGISDFFETIKAVDDNNVTTEEFVIKANQLREDVVINASDEEKALIMKNFPQIQGTYLVVPKVI